MVFSIRLCKGKDNGDVIGHLKAYKRFILGVIKDGRGKSQLYRLSIKKLPIQITFPDKFNIALFVFLFVCLFFSFILVETKVETSK